MVNVLEVLTHIRADIDGMRRLNLVELEALWRHCLPKQPIPEVRCLLWQGLAWRLQGDKQPSSVTIQKLLSTVRRASSHPSTKPDALAFVPTLKLAPMPEGTRLVRKWRDRHYEVLVEGATFYFNGKRYSSLTTIAGEITGAHWSGPRFFGLVQRRKGSLCQR